MRDLVEKIEEALPKVLEQYLDKVEYGKLSISGSRIAGGGHGNTDPNSTEWSLNFYYLFKNVDAIYMFLTPTNQFIIQDGENMEEDATLKDLIPIVSQIPERRLQEIRDYNKGPSNISKFLEELEATCRTENCKPTDLYTEEELEFARNLE